MKSDFQNCRDHVGKELVRIVRIQNLRNEYRGTPSLSNLRTLTGCRMGWKVCVTRPVQLQFMAKHSTGKSCTYAVAGGGGAGERGGEESFPSSLPPSLSSFFLPSSIFSQNYWAMTAHKLSSQGQKRAIQIGQIQYLQTAWQPVVPVSIFQT